MLELVPSSLTVEEGDTTELTCNMKMTSARNCNRPFFSWMFINQTGKEYVIANASQVKQGPLNDKFEAYYYQVVNTLDDYKSCIFILVLLDVTSVLEGQYKCIWSKQVSHPTFVSVVPSQESVQPECDLRINNRTQTLQELELVCKAYPANPLVNLVWFDRGQEMRSSSSSSPGGTLTTKSQVPPRNDSSSEVEFVCQAYNSSGYELPGSCSVICQINISVQVAMDYISDKPLGTFQCPFRMSVGGIRFQRQWLFDGKPINQHNQSDRFISEGPTGLLHMTEVLPSDNGKMVTCEVTTTFGTYKAEAIIQSQASDKDSLSETDVPNNLMPIVAIIIAAGVLILFVNIFVCAVISKCRGRKHHSVSQGNVPAHQQEEGLYASGIVVFDANGAQVGIDYTPMNEACAGHYDPDEPYEAMNDECHRESEYQVPSVDVDGLPIKRQQSIKYMNTMQGAKNRGFHVFSFSKKKSQKNSKDGLSVGARGRGKPPLSPNCYAQPHYGCEQSLNVPPNNTKENDYDELR